MQSFTIPHSALMSYFYFYLYLAFSGWLTSQVLAQSNNGSIPGIPGTGNGGLPSLNSTTPRPANATAPAANGTAPLANSTVPPANGTLNNTRNRTSRAIHLNQSTDSAYINHNLDMNDLSTRIGAGGVLDSSSSRLSTGAIVGLTVGIVAGALFIGALVLVLIRRRASRSPPSTPGNAAAAAAPSAAAKTGELAPKPMDGNPRVAQEAITAAGNRPGAVHRFQVGAPQPMMLSEDGGIVELKAVASGSPEVVPNDMHVSQRVMLDSNGALTPRASADRADIPPVMPATPLAPAIPESPTMPEEPADAPEVPAILHEAPTMPLPPTASEPSVTPNVPGTPVPMAHGIQPNLHPSVLVEPDDGAVSTSSSLN